MDHPANERKKIGDFDISMISYQPLRKAKL